MSDADLRLLRRENLRLQQENDELRSLVAHAQDQTIELARELGYLTGRIAGEIEGRAQAHETAVAAYQAREAGHIH